MPVAIGALVALPVAYYASRRRDRGSGTPHRCEPSCTSPLTAVHHPLDRALFVLMPLILGTSIISPR